MKKRFLGHKLREEHGFRFYNFGSEMLLNHGWVKGFSFLFQMSPTHCVILLCIVLEELVGGGPVAVDVGLIDM